MPAAAGWSITPSASEAAGGRSAAGDGSGLNHSTTVLPDSFGSACFARAFLFMLTELGIRDERDPERERGREPVAVGVHNERWSRAG